MNVVRPVPRTVPVFTVLLLSALLLLSGCAPTQNTDTGRKTAASVEPAAAPARASRLFGSIAVYDIALEHPTARLVYRGENIRDRIARGLQETGGFKVIDWRRLDDVLFRRNLEHSDLLASDAVRREIGEVLLNDYFLQGAVTSFGERMEFSADAFSKQKTQVTDVDVELFVKNALTNEIIAAANGHGATTKTISQTLGFGAAGGNDTIVANQALGLAIDAAIEKLVAEMNQKPLSSPPATAASTTSPDTSFIRQPNVKVLIVLAEIEERVGNRIVKNSDSDRFTSSIVEKAMAKVFVEAGYQVLTGDDVLGKAYAVSGDEHILLSGWVDEADIEQFENLLQARTGLSAYALEVGRIAHADIVVTGEVKYELTETAGPGQLSAKTNNVVLSAKALLVHGDKTYHVAIRNNSFTTVLQSTAMQARETALAQAAEAAGREILTRTPQIEK